MGHTPKEHATALRAARSPRPVATPASTPKKIEVVYFPKRATPLPPAPGGPVDAGSEEIHTEVVEITAAEPFTDPGLAESADLSRAPTEREMRAVDAQLLTPSDGIAAIGGLEDAASTLAYHRLRLREHVARTPPSRPFSDLTDLSLFGHSLLEQGRLEEARVVFEGIVAREPRDAFPYVMLGAVYLAQGDDSRANALFEAALDFEPHDPAALTHRAELKIRRGDVTSALKDLDRVIARDPNGREPVTRRARALRAQHGRKTGKRR